MHDSRRCTPRRDWRFMTVKLCGKDVFKTWNSITSILVLIEHRFNTTLIVITKVVDQPHIDRVLYECHNMLDLRFVEDFKKIILDPSPNSSWTMRDLEISHWPHILPYNFTLHLPHHPPVNARSPPSPSSIPLYPPVLSPPRLHRP